MSDVESTAAPASPSFEETLDSLVGDADAASTEDTSEDVEGVEGEDAETEDVETEDEGESQEDEGDELPKKESERWNKLRKLDRENRALQNQVKQLRNLEAVGQALQQDPVGALKAMGVPVDVILEGFANHYSDGESGKAAPSENKEVAELRAEIAAMKAAQQQEQAQAQQSEVVHYLDTVAKSNGDRWHYVARTPEVYVDIMQAAETDARAGYSIDETWVQSTMDQAESILRERYGAPETAQAHTDTPEQKKRKQKTTLGQRKGDSSAGLKGLSFEEALARMSGQK